MAIFENQTAARLIFQTGINFNNYTITTKTVYYEKPDGTQGTWTPSILSGGEIAGKLYFDFDSTHKFDMVGLWRVWIVLVFGDTRTAQSEIATYRVISEEAIL